MLCDVILPNGLKGPQVVEALSRNYPNACVIYMSGYTENLIIHNHRLDDGVTLLQKPFTMSDLVAAFTDAMRSADK